LLVVVDLSSATGSAHVLQKCSTESGLSVCTLFYVATVLTVNLLSKPTQRSDDLFLPSCWCVQVTEIMAKGSFSAIHTNGCVNLWPSEIRQLDLHYHCNFTTALPIWTCKCNKTNIASFLLKLIEDSLESLRNASLCSVYWSVAIKYVTK
jgi:hypothetical protein